jgi:hypothetical protein
MGGTVGILAAAGAVTRSWPDRTVEGAARIRIGHHEVATDKATRPAPEITTEDALGAFQWGGVREVCVVRSPVKWEDSPSVVAG